MRSSSSHPRPPGDSAGLAAACWLLLLGIGLVPLLWLPGFHTGFEAPRRALVLAVLAPVAAWVLARRPDLRGRARVPVACVLLVAAAGVLPHVGALDVHTAWRSARHLGAVLALVLAGAALARPRDLPRLHLALLLPAIPVLVIGVARRELGVPGLLPDRPDVAISSTIGNSNALGEAFATVFLAGVALAPAMRSRTTRVLAWLGCGCALALVAVSRSRGAWLAAASGVLVAAALWCHARRGDRALVRRVATAGLAAAALAAAWLASPWGVGARATLTSLVSTTHGTNAVRLAIWAGTTEMTRDALPFGVGLGRFEDAYLPYRRASEWSLSGVDSRVDSPHQELLWIASETGVPGTLAALALLLVALSRALRGGPPEQAPTRRALLLATIGLAVLSAFRSPLHHPSGVLAFAALLGATPPRPPGRARSPADLLVVPVVLGLVVAAALDLGEDLRLGGAVAALNDAKGRARQGDAAAALLLESGRRFETVGDAILKDFDRTFRAALAADELADVKDGLRAASPDESFPDLPDRQDVSVLLDEVLRLCPRHPGATTTLALAWLKGGSVARAVAILEEAVAELPNAPRFRANLAWIHARSERFTEAHFWMTQEIETAGAASREQQLLLASWGTGLCRDEATFGRYLGPVDAAAARPDPAPAEARAARRTELLLRLLERHDDGHALASLAECDYALAASGAAGADVGAEGNRAYARSRVRFALAAAGEGDLGQAETFLRLGVQKDPGLLDAWFLRAKVAARDGRPDDAAGHLRAILDRGVRATALAAWVGRDPDLGPLQAAGRLPPPASRSR
jgi:Tfp pilus assembly protein PilF